MDIERWKLFPKTQQLLMVGSEIMRARVWQGKDGEKFKMALERGLDLLDLTIGDEQWKGRYGMLLWLRNEIGKFYIGLRQDDIGLLYDAL